MGFAYFWDRTKVLFTDIIFPFLKDWFTKGSEFFFMGEFLCALFFIGIIYLLFNDSPHWFFQLLINGIGLTAGIYGYQVVNMVVTIGSICLENDNPNTEAFDNFSVTCSGALIIFLFPVFNLAQIATAALFLVFPSFLIYFLKEGSLEDLLNQISLMFFGVGGVLVSTFNILVFLVGVFSSRKKREITYNMYELSVPGISLLLMFGSFRIISFYMYNLQFLEDIKQFWIFGGQMNFDQPFSGSTLGNTWFFYIYFIISAVIMLFSLIYFATKSRGLEVLSFFWIILILGVSMALPVVIRPTLLRMIYEQIKVTVSVAHFIGNIFYFQQFRIIFLMGLFLFLGIPIVTIILLKNRD